MKIATSRFGNIEIDEKEIIVFEEGLLGFAGYHRYVILNTDEKSPFRWLQCVDDGTLAFVVTEPLNFMFDYDIEISDSDAGFIDLKRAEDAVLYVIVSIPENPKNMTANLQGPLVVNAANRRCRQIISNNAAHSTRVNILKEMEKRAAKLKQAQKPTKTKTREGKR